MNSRLKSTLLHLAALSLFSGGVAAAPVTYQLLDWGSRPAETRLGGTISVDDADGNQVIVVSEILDWSFSGALLAFGSPAAGPSVPLPFGMAMGAGSQVTCATTGCFLLDGLDLVLALRSQGPTLFVDASGSRLDVAGDRGLSGDAVAGDLVTAMRWSNASGTATTMMSVTAPPNHLRIATTGTVPEPSSAALLALALAAAAGANRSRRRHPTR